MTRLESSTTKPVNILFSFVYFIKIYIALISLTFKNKLKMLIRLICRGKSFVCTCHLPFPILLFHFLQFMINALLISLFHFSLSKTIFFNDYDMQCPYCQLKYNSTGLSMDDNKADATRRVVDILLIPIPVKIFHLRLRHTLRFGESRLG